MCIEPNTNVSQVDDSLTFATPRMSKLAQAGVMMSNYYAQEVGDSHSECSIHRKEE